MPSEGEPLAGRATASVSRPTPWRWPLMTDNITRADLDAVITYLSGDNPRLTNGPSVSAFEDSWSRWLGVAHAVMVNSGSSANDLSMLALKHLRGQGDVIVSPLGWVSDIASILHAGHEPVFVDIDLQTLAPSAQAICDAVTPKTKGLLMVHVLGLNALTRDHLDLIADRPGLALIEDVAEAHGAMVGSQLAGSIGWLSNFSFYYAHHLTTIEGGAVCTDDPEVYEVIRMLRAHGLVREIRDSGTREARSSLYADLNPEFIFEYPAHNMRPTEIQGLLGMSQLSRLDANNELRRANFALFLDLLDSERYMTDFSTVGSCNYAFIALMREPDLDLRDRIERAMQFARIEYRRGLSGGGNQLRQPYARRLFPAVSPEGFRNAEHVHRFGWYLGNHPRVESKDVAWLCDVLNTA